MRSIPRIAVPVRLTVCGLPLALSVIVRVAVNVPVPVRAKLTEIVQLPPALRLDPHPLVTMYLGELAVILVIVTTDVPVLVMITFWLGLVVLKICWLKVRVVGERVTLASAAASVGHTKRKRI